MFICEVVAGKSEECDSLHYVSELSSPYNSILGIIKTFYYYKYNIFFKKSIRTTVSKS